MDREKPISGSVSLGQHHILPNYFEQNQVSSRSVLCTICSCFEVGPDAALLISTAICGEFLPDVPYII